MWVGMLGRLLVVHELVFERRERGRVEGTARGEVADRQLDVVDRHGTILGQR
jgi:hypothetical protein